MRLVAEGAPDGAIAMELTMQMLLDVSPDIGGKAWRRRKYLVNVVPVLEVAIAGIAVEVLLDHVVA